jgi:hypothetical protein
VRHRIYFFRIYFFLVAVALVATMASMLAAGSSGSGSITISNSTPIVQRFDSLTSSGNSPSMVLPTGWYLTESGAGGAADGAYVVGTGSSFAGGAYSFGAAADSERALGSVGSGTVTPIIYGARFTNNGSGPITALSISFDGEMWRRGPATTVDLLTFSYSTTSTTVGDLTPGIFTNVPALNFNSLGNACQSAAGATNGNAAACRSTISATITGLSVNPRASIWIRWVDTDTMGSDDGLAIDNVTVAATFSSDPTPPTSTGSASPNPANPGQHVTLSGTIAPGFNPLSQSYTVTCDLTAIGGSSAQVLPTQAVPDDGVIFNYVAEVSTQAALGAAPLPCFVEDDQRRSTPFGISLTILLPLNENCSAGSTQISSIQGPGALSPLAGNIVDVEAIVVGDFQGAGGLSGFYIEEPPSEQDGNPATSEGVFVFSSTPVTMGDRVRVRGTVAEFTSATGSAISRLTEVGSVSSVQVCISNEVLPAPIDITLPVDDLSRWERYEGRLQPWTVRSNRSRAQRSACADADRRQRLHVERRGRPHNSQSNRLG